MTRVGLIVPSSNSIAEVDFYRRLPSAATLHTARMHLEDATPEAEEEMLDEHLPRAIADIASHLTQAGMTPNGAQHVVAVEVQVEHGNVEARVEQLWN